jgi:hypothetical protein
VFHADGWRDRQTDMMRLIVTFYNFANAPKKEGQQVVVSCKYCATTPTIPLSLINIGIQK